MIVVSEGMSLDSDECVSLSQVLSSFNSSINEEQCWAICHQTIQCLKNIFKSNNLSPIHSSEHLFISKDGSVHQKTFFDNRNENSKQLNGNQLMSSLGVVLFQALDYGLMEDEERCIGHQLESLIDRLTTGQHNEENNRDEGIETDFEPFDDVIKICVLRTTLPDPSDHYRAVCRALVAETLELNTFLDQMSFGRQTELKQCYDWARLWVQVIQELRLGVKLKKTIRNENVICCYELTPFEMLLNDIRFQNYKLNKTNIARRDAHRDAHQHILDFIRSRPTLQSVSKRQLKPICKQMTVYDKLMASIRQQHKLKPIHKDITTISSTSRTTSTDLSQTPQSCAPQRRLIKADLNLKLSFDDEEDEQQNDVNSRQFSLKNLSLRLLSHERRHSIGVCESPEDVSQDLRHHVANIWETTDWGHSLHCLSLTLHEVQHIRSVLTRAEIESLAVTKQLRNDLENGKICFTCLKTRFSFFGQMFAINCKLCLRSVCDRCATKMHIPCENFEKVPIYMLSPTPSPPDHPLPPSEWPIDPKPQMNVSKKKWRLMSKDSVVVDSGCRKSGPLVRVCRDCKILVRHLIGNSSFTNKTH